MFRVLISAAFGTLLFCSLGLGQIVGPEPPPDPTSDSVPLPTDDPNLDDGIDVLTRGPVHEAFAEQISPDPAEGLTAPKAPPEPVNEVSPDVKPEGDDVVWIDGYWFWDDERDDYVWVSGVWRRIPPGRRWMPGYWQDVDGGYRWVPGFWGSASASELEYLDLPPKSLEAGPSSPAPSDDSFWVPGNWAYAVGDYRWRPGYWRDHRDGWTWVGSRYVLTPRGCLYVPGYWDHTLTRRGCLFAPVYFRRPVYARLGFSYRPACWINYNSLLMHLFVRPHCHHYYFGDYYSPIYRQRHFVPCYQYHSRHIGYASLYVYYQHHFRRHGIDYCGRVRDWHHHYHSHPHHRPAHTYRSQLANHSVNRRAPRPQEAIGHYFRPTSSQRIAGSKPVRVSSGERERLVRDTAKRRELSSDRRAFESTRRASTRRVGSYAGRAKGGPESFVLPQAKNGTRARTSPRSESSATARRTSPPTRDHGGTTPPLTRRRVDGEQPRRPSADANKRAPISHRQRVAESRLPNSRSGEMRLPTARQPDATKSRPPATTRGRGSATSRGQSGRTRLRSPVPSTQETSGKALFRPRSPATSELLRRRFLGSPSNDVRRVQPSGPTHTPKTRGPIASPPRESAAAMQRRLADMARKLPQTSPRGKTASSAGRSRTVFTPHANRPPMSSGVPRSGTRGSAGTVRSRPPVVSRPAVKPPTVKLPSRATSRSSTRASSSTGGRAARRTGERRK